MTLLNSKIIKIVAGVAVVIICAVVGYTYKASIFQNSLGENVAEASGPRKLVKGEQKLPTTTVTTAKGMIIGGSVTRKGNKYTIEPNLLPMSRTITEDVQAESKVSSTIYRIDVVRTDGKVTKFPTSVSECIDDMCFPSGKDLKEGAKSYLDNIIIADSSSMKVINFYVNDKLVKAYKPLSKTPKVSYITKRVGTQRVNNGTNKGVFIGWDFENSKDASFSFSYIDKEGKWATSMFGKVSDYKNQKSYFFDLDPNYDDSTPDKTDIRVTITDGFTSHTLEAKNVQIR